MNLRSTIQSSQQHCQQTQHRKTLRATKTSTMSRFVTLKDDTTTKNKTDYKLSFVPPHNK
jgi:hypothetical protein